MAEGIKKTGIQLDNFAEYFVDACREGYRLNHEGWKRNKDKTKTKR